MTQKADSLPYCTKVPKGSLISFLGSIAIHTLPLTSLGLNGALSRNGPGRDDWLWPIYLKAQQWGQPRCWAVWEWSGQNRNCFVLPTPRLMGSALRSSPHVALLVFPVHVLPTVSKGVPGHIHLLEAEIRSRPGSWVSKKQSLHISQL